MGVGGPQWAAVGKWQSADQASMSDVEAVRRSRVEWLGRFCDSEGVVGGCRASGSGGRLNRGVAQSG